MVVFVDSELHHCEPLSARIFLFKGESVLNLNRIPRSLIELLIGYTDARLLLLRFTDVAHRVPGNFKRLT